MIDVSFVQKQDANTYDFVSSSGTENLYWQTIPAAVNNNNSTQIHEVLQPAKILDTESTQTVIQLQAMQVMKGASMVLATSDRQSFVFLVKLSTSSKSPNKSKVKKADSVVSLTVKQHLIVAQAFLNDQSLVTVQGTSFTLSKSVSQLFEDSKIVAQISIGSEEQVNNQAAKKKNNNQDEYMVVEMDQTRQLNPQF